jgi:hypothetical protein
VQQLGSLLDHLIGATLHGLWHGNAERLGGLEVDRKLEFGRRLHRQVSRFLALEDAVDIAGGTPKPVPKISSIRDQTADSREQTLGVDREWMPRLFVSMRRAFQISTLCTAGLPITLPSLVHGLYLRIAWLSLEVAR